MRIEVTQDDIAAGHRKDAYCCPVALAIRRELGIPASVTGGTATVDYAAPWATAVWLPDAVSDFVELFDRGEPVESFAFDLAFDLAAHEAERAGRRRS